MSDSISARRVRELVGTLSGKPVYASLAHALTLLIGDGQIPVGVRLPSERELMQALDLSRTTVSRAYASLRDLGYAYAHTGSGTFTSLPGGRERVRDRVLMPKGAAANSIDLNCAADSAAADVMMAYTAALSDLPAYLGGHGYFPSGLPVLQEAIAKTYQARGLATDPQQIIVTPGALTAFSVVVRALLSRRGTALIESPTYPNAAEMLRASGITLHEAGIDSHGWDIEGIMKSVKQLRPDLVYLIPDFHNPTGAVMSAAQREKLGRALHSQKTLTVVDETHQSLALDGQPMPAPFAASNPDCITLGSMSKAFWGGLRVGWIRAPHALVERLTHSRMSLDLGVPVAEQLAATYLLNKGPVSASHIERLRVQRDALIALVTTHLPDWQFIRPTGGLALWCQLPHRGATALAATLEESHVIISPGPVFSPSGGLDTYVRLPWTRPVAELEQAVMRIAAAWNTGSHTVSLASPARRRGRHPAI